MRERQRRRAGNSRPTARRRSMTWLSDSAVARLRNIADWPTPSDARYDILEPIARGGMGTIYLARRPSAQSVGCVQGACDTTELIDRVCPRLASGTRGAEILARLNHPGIVPVYDLGVLDDRRPYYVMKRVEGPTLAKHRRPINRLPSGCDCSCGSASRWPLPMLAA